MITATNVGASATDGTPITLKDVLPGVLGATGVSGYDAYGSHFAFNGSGSASMTCEVATVACSYNGAVAPGDSLVMSVALDAGQPTNSPEDAANTTELSGGGAVGVTVDTPVRIDTARAEFGPTGGENFVALSSNQAGGHPNITTNFSLNTREVNGAPENVKDIEFELPRGMVGSALHTSQCTMHQVLGGFAEPNACPSDAMVGIATLRLGTGELGPRGGPLEVVVPVYNIAPAPGEPLAFGFDGLLLPVRLDTTVLSNGNYAARVGSHDLSEAAIVMSGSITIWGVPARHNGPGPNGEATAFGQQFGGPNPGETQVALLTNPTQCTEPLTGAMSADSWSNPGQFVSSGPLAAETLTGCDLLAFEPGFEIRADTLKAGVPAGYEMQLTIPQHEDPSGTATPDVKAVTVKLPVGTVLNPAAASGLRACSDLEFYGPHPHTQDPAAPANCPPESKIGSVEITSPALAETMHGAIYVGEPKCNPCGPQDAQGRTMLRLFLQAEDQGESKIIVKSEGLGEIDQQTGRLTTVFEDTPQLPFSRLNVKIEGGSRAPLVNPRTCGTNPAALEAVPWSFPDTGVTRTFLVEVVEACFGPQFAPSFVAGTTNDRAGAFSPLTVSVARPDSDEFVSAVQVTMPPGLVGSIASVPPCGEPQAAEGTCPASSLLGHTVVAAGPGPDPLQLNGSVYFTGSYKGAPFGLSFVVPASAGPYTLSGTTGHGTVVVRAAIEIDPHTARVTVKSDALPQALDGIPLQVKIIDVVVDRPEFILNPTSCAPMALDGAIVSNQNMAESVSSRFQATECRGMGFKPSFAVSTQAKHDKVHGASLHVTVKSKRGDANIGSVKVNLPKQLPSRLSTLNLACTEKVFDENPAACPEASRVGTATATTPVLPVPLTGPAYFVSHGGAKFPELIIVLQGDGVTLDLAGETFISSKGITSSTFGSVPDVPVTRFDLILPTGVHSVLAGNGNFCTTPMTMPTTIKGQNGALIKQNTKVAVSGCKPQVTVVRKHVTGTTATIVASVPSAGKLVATGSGLSGGSRKLAGKGTATVGVKLSKREQQFLSHHPRRKLRVRVNLRFKPTHGTRLSTSVILLMG